MKQYVVIIIFSYLLVLKEITTKPLHLTIYCNNNDQRKGNNKFRIGTDSNPTDNFDDESLCDIIIKAMKENKIIPTDPNQDMTSSSNDFNPIFQSTPKDFIRTPFTNTHINLPRLKLPQIRIPKIKIPKFKGLPKFPILGVSEPENTEVFVIPKYYAEEYNSAERVDKFKKEIRKMLHVVKMFKQADEYLSKRMRIIIDKLSMLLSD